jgi:hypothetical protein
LKQISAWQVPSKIAFVGFSSAGTYQRQLRAQRFVYLLGRRKKSGTFINALFKFDNPNIGFLKLKTFRLMR